MKTRQRFFLFLPGMLFSIQVFSQGGFNIIPKPVVEISGRGVFTFKNKIHVALVGITEDSAKTILDAFNTAISNKVTFPIKTYKPEEKIFLSSPAPMLELRQEKSEFQNAEGYRMLIEPQRITIKADQARGFFYAIQTLLQLIPNNQFTSTNPDMAFTEIPCSEIIDYPHYSYRGMHLDVCRHFFPVAFIKKYIDLMAMHKMNYFHWHLTEDQGWRIEIKKYPKLTEVGSNRKESMVGAYDESEFDGAPYGGFYTQEEIREIVLYAQQKFVTIIPEIEMPGHSLAALSSYPELSCTGGPFEVATKWGVFEDIYCTKETTFQFLEGVLEEVCELFPGPYIHIGGDESPKIRWKSCNLCQVRIKTEGLKDENELQSYFIKRVEKFLNEHGKKIIGWDEILEGGLAPNATVMSWRGADGGIAAARMDHDVIMTPGSHCYFDHYQSDPSVEPLAFGGYTTVEKVYSYEPTPANSLTTEQQKHIIGAQGNVWTEYILTPEHAEYMAYPRAIALSEVLWSEKKSRNWNIFSNRLINHFERLKRLDVNYSKSIYDITASVSADTINNRLLMALKKSIDRGRIFYTTNGEDPTTQSEEYSQPFPVTRSSTVKARLIVDSIPGKILSTDFYIHKASGMPYELTSPWKQYDGATSFALTDGIAGEINRYNTWVGFSGKDFGATLDLKSSKNIEKVSVNFYNKNRDWIFLPTVVEVYISDDGKEFKQVGRQEIIKDDEANDIRNVTFSFFNTDKRYVKVIARNIGKCPDESVCAGQDAWLFADEIIVE